MALIKTIAEVKAVLHVSNLHEDATLPDMEAAGEKYILPVLGAELYEYLQEAYDASELNTLEQELLKKIQKPLASFAYFDDLPAMHLKITDAGVRRTTTDNMPSAFRWEFEEAREFLINRGHQGLESLFTYLEKYKSVFTDWVQSPAYTTRKQFLIQSGIDFNTKYTLFQPLRTYQALIPTIGYAEDNYVAPVIGAVFFRELKDEETPGEEEKEVVKLLKYAIAFYTIKHACEKLPVRISDAGFTVLAAAANETRDAGRENAAAAQIDLLMKSCERDGALYMNKAIDLLNAKASETIFTTYFESDFYTAPADPGAVPDDRNRNRKNLYL